MRKNKVTAILVMIMFALTFIAPAISASDMEDVAGHLAETTNMTESSTQEITIISFDELSENEKYITVPLGITEEELSLPETVTAAVEYDVYEEEGGDVLENRVDENVALAVTWNSEVDFSSIAEAEFLFTAKLTDENYTLAEGVEMPKITVRLIDQSALLDPEFKESNDIWWNRTLW